MGIEINSWKHGNLLIVETHGVLTSLAKYLRYINSIGAILHDSGCSQIIVDNRILLVPDVPTMFEIGSHYTAALLGIVLSNIHILFIASSQNLPFYEYWAHTAKEKGIRAEVFTSLVSGLHATKEICSIR